MAEASTLVRQWAGNNSYKYVKRKEIARFIDVVDGTLC